MEPIEPYAAELRQAVADGILSKVQVEILLDRASGKNYEALIRDFGLSGPTPLTHCLLRTAGGYFWEPSMEGGGDRYLSAIDEVKFCQFVQNAADEINCLSTDVALSLAQRLHADRLNRARKILVLVKCPQLAARIPLPVAPCRSWLTETCHKLGINICRGQELELLRRIYCDYDIVVEWFTTISALFCRPRQLMFNMDETFLSTAKKLHCLSLPTQNCLVTGFQASPHMTGAITIHGGGARMKPLVILPRKKTVKSLEQFEDSAYLSSTTTGWMTKSVYRYFALTFVAEVSRLRAQWPESLRDEPILLFVDGHPSRWDFVANLIFWTFNIDVVCFPGHSSHLLQMFDVCIAAPLKQEFKKQLYSQNFTSFLESFDPSDISTGKMRADHLRATMLDAFLCSCDQVITKKNCAQSFAVTGVSPYNPARVLESDYAVAPPVDGVYPRRTGKASGRWLTAEENLRQMFFEENGRELTDQDLKLRVADVYTSLRNGSLDTGIPLGSPPELLLPVADRQFRLFKLEEL